MGHVHFSRGIQLATAVLRCSNEGRVDRGDPTGGGTNGQDFASTSKGVLQTNASILAILMAPTEVGNVRVLLIEDSLILAPRLVELIESVPRVRVIAHVTDAPAAITKIAQWKPDVVVTEISLRQGSGFDVLRATQRLPARPIMVVLTHRVSSTLRAAASRLGAAHFFDKASELDALHKALANLAPQFTIRNGSDD